MTTPTVRELVSAANSGGSATVTTGAGTAVNDYLVVFYGCDFYNLSDMGSPSGTAGSWTLEGTADAGANIAHMKLYTRLVTASGAQTVTVPAVIDSEVYQHCYVVAGAGTVNDGVAGNFSATTSASPVAPSVAPAGSDDLLLCSWQTAGGASTNFTAAPPGMTNLIEVDDIFGFATLATAREVLAAAGATGTRTASTSDARAYASMSIAIRGASAAASRTPLVVSQYGGFF